MTSKERYSEIRKRLEAAEPYPWPIGMSDVCERERAILYANAPEDIAYLLARVEKLEKVRDASQKMMNQIFCYSTGSSVMAEEDMAEIFAEWSEAQDALEDSL